QNAPEPDFSWQSGAASGEIAFTNNSLNADTYLWDFGDGNQSDLVDPVHIYAQNGSYPVTLTAVNACGERVITDTVLVIISGLLDPKEAGIALRLYPNPGYGPVHIALDGPATPQIRVRILDATGVCISDREFNFSSGVLRYEPGSDSWPAGVYFVQVLCGGQSYGMRVRRF
ncbi:MAG: PKD domain-containing protein, partial [Saprospiraceae bacterium]|nr:PKD domain-containing protein [Saprospiraceae bacterium]